MKPTGANVRLLGAPSWATDVDSAGGLIVERAFSGRGGYACLCNVHVLMDARRDARIASALEEAWRVFADGAPVAWLQRRNGAPFARRVAGADLMLEVMKRGAATKLRHALYGSTAETLERLEWRLTQLVPSVRIVYRESPPYVSADEVVDLPLDRMNEVEPQVVWCGLGAPKQELWMQGVAGATPAVLVGVGAAFDFLGGTQRRAPRWMQEHALEWLYRLSREPRRLGPRYLATNARFVTAVALEQLVSRP